MFKQDPVRKCTSVVELRSSSRVVAAKFRLCALPCEPFAVYFPLTNDTANVYNVMLVGN